MKMSRAVVALLVVFASPRAASADFFITPFIGRKFGGSTSIVDLERASDKRKLVLGIGARQVDDGIIGYEVEFGNIAGFFGNEEFAAIEPLVKSGSYVNDLTGSIVLSLPPALRAASPAKYSLWSSPMSEPAMF